MITAKKYINPSNINSTQKSVEAIAVINSSDILPLDIILGITIIISILGIIILG